MPAGKKSMAEIYLGLGSNIGNRLDFLSEAIRLIETRIAPLTKYSSLYETEAWGNKNQPSFLNQVVKLDSSRDVFELLSELKNIEKYMGRVKREKWGERNIDIDLLFYNGLIINDKRLKLPHPGITERLFVLIPLEEIAPEFRHPVEKKTISELRSLCADTLDVILFKSGNT